MKRIQNSAAKYNGNDEERKRMVVNEESCSDAALLPPIITD
jgi:hypothetical protein